MNDCQDLVILLQRYKTYILSIDCFSNSWPSLIQPYHHCQLNQRVEETEQAYVVDEVVVLDPSECTTKQNFRMSVEERTATHFA